MFRLSHIYFLFLYVIMDRCEVMLLFIYLFFSLSLWFCFLLFTLLLYAITSNLFWFMKHVEVTIMF